MMVRQTLFVALVLAGIALSDAKRQPPHLIFILTDDLGWNYPGYHNSEVLTPTLDKLASGGVRLESHYTYKYCSPTRGAFLTGRYPWHLASVRCNFIPSSIPEGVHLDYQMLPRSLARANYSSHHVGKWHLGFHTPEYTPVGRGFDSSFGFLEGGEDHYTHWCGASQLACEGEGEGKAKAKLGAFDLWQQNTSHFPGAPVRLNDTDPSPTAPGADERYSGYVFTRRAVDIVRAHDAGTGPLFLYLALHNTHSPIEAPPRFVAPYEKRPGFENETRKQTLSAMVSVVDESVKNITDALAERGFLDNSLVVWTTDNGSPVNAGGSNFPLRGGKGSNWEGGVRVPTFVYGGAVPSAMAGKQLGGLAHIADWHATFLGLAGLEPEAPAAGPAPASSLDLWPYLSGSAAASPRSELVHDHHMFTNASANIPGGGVCAGQDPFALPGYSALGALRQGDFKLIVGVEFQASWYGRFSPNASVVGKIDVTQHEACRDRPCLFNVATDPTEHNDIAGDPSQAARLKTLLARFKELEAEYHPPVVSPRRANATFCAAVRAHGGFVAPYAT